VGLVFGTGVGALIGGGFLVGRALLRAAGKSAVRAAGKGAVRNATKRTLRNVGGDAVAEVRSLVDGGALRRLRAAFESGTSAEFKLGGRTILVEPDAPFSGMTLFEEAGFVLGRDAFSSNAELTKTLLQEVFRLRTSARVGGAGASGDLATRETQNAFEFAERAFREFFK